mgnify:CR=1 FL=1
MEARKCGRCFRSDYCSLKALAEQTLPWVVKALRFDGTDWDKAHRVRRALRGCGGCPGYVEDWELAGAIDRRDLPSLVESIIHSPRVTLELLCGPCRHYQGPQLGRGERAGCAA